MIGGVLLVAVAAVARGPRSARIAVGALGACLVVHPIVVVAVAGAGVVVMAVGRIVRRSQDADTVAADELLAIDLMALGVSGGLTFHQAVTFAGAAVGGPVAEGLDRRTRQLLSGRTADASDGPIAAAFAAAARSASSGAVLRPALDAVAETVRRERAAEERMRLARLPVKLLFPLALLILPGFVLLAVAPAVISGLARLAG